MNSRSFTFESTRGGEIELIAYDNGRFRLRSGSLRADGHQVKTREYSSHKMVELWANDCHLVSGVRVEKYVGRRVEVEASRMESEVNR